LSGREIALIFNGLQILWYLFGLEGEKMAYWMVILILGLGLLGCESGHGNLTSGQSTPPLEDPSVAIVKKTLMTDGYWEDFCNRAAGVDGKAEWAEGVTKYKDNPDLSIVVVRVEKNKTEEYSKAGVVFVVNKKTKNVEVIHTEIDGKAEVPLITVASMERMALQSSKTKGRN
jgi:hypothetical protein